MTPRLRIATAAHELANEAAQRNEPTPDGVIVFLYAIGIMGTGNAWRDSRTLSALCHAWAPLKLDTADVGNVDDGEPLAWSD